ncbi:MAG: glutaredoxin family protein [Xanthomonadales bacterium]|nr:glutaredoxin family protein [Xanthomonadales bacterium]
MPNIAVLRGAGLAFLLVMLAACTRQADIAEVRAAIGDAPVVLLSTSTCGYCKKLRADLAAWGVDYVDLDVESNDDGWRAYDLVNGRGVPILVIGDKVVHGYAPDRSRNMLLAAKLIPDSSTP